VRDREHRLPESGILWSIHECHGLGEPCRRRPVDAETDDDELVAADSRHGVALSHALAKAAGYSLQEGVAGGMPVAIVRLLESVDVDDHDCDTAALSQDPGRSTKAVLETAPVQSTGKGISLRLRSEPVDALQESMSQLLLETMRVGLLHPLLHGGDDGVVQGRERVRGNAEPPCDSTTPLVRLLRLGGRGLLGGRPDLLAATPHLTATVGWAHHDRNR